MTNNLEKAKELKKKLPCKIISATGRLSIQFMEKSNNKRKLIQEKAKVLNKEIKKGCGKEFILEDFELMCGKRNIWKEMILCPDCKKSIKICEEILK